MSRVIAGSAKGRRLHTPPGGSTRPTTDRVREAVFASLASWAGTAGSPSDQTLAGLAFCDLYAGSGAVGLEAASRGARPVLLIESDRRASEVIRRNVDESGLSVQLRTGTVEQLTTRPQPQFYDVIWADPPYDLASELVDGLIQTLVGGWLAPDGLIVVERSSRSPAPTWPTGTRAWDARYGETTVHFGQHGADQ